MTVTTEPEQSHQGGQKGEGGKTLAAAATSH